MKVVVVTGATGFIGGQFAKYLLSLNYQVYAVIRNPQKLDFKHPNLKVIKADFLEYHTLCEQIPHADYFYHFAWSGAYGQATADYRVQLDNVYHTCEALYQAIKMNCKKFILAGTVAELEVIEHIENNICVPRGTCIYAAAKLNAEMMCKTIAGANNIEFNCGLFANTVGPGDFSQRSTNFILNKFIHGEAPKLVEGTAKNDWLYIDDAVRLIRAMGEHGLNMKTYYIGHTNLWTLREIITKARDIVAPEITLNFGEIPDSFITNYKYISTTALYEDTGVKAEHPFEDAMKKTAEWVKTLSF